LGAELVILDGKKGEGFSSSRYVKKRWEIVGGGYGKIGDGKRKEKCLISKNFRLSAAYAL